MKIFVKTLKGTHFEIQVTPQHSVSDVKKTIETCQGSEVYPAEQQMLIHQGKVLKDGTTLEENNVAENSFIVIMLTKTKGSSGEASTTSAVPAKVPQTIAPASAAPTPTATAGPASVATPAPAPVSAPSPAPSPAPVSTTTVTSDADPYGQAASNLVAGSNLEGTIQQILDMGGGTWDRSTVVRALRAAFNNPERAIDYLYSGIPENVDIPPVARAPASAQPTGELPSQPPRPAQPAPAPSSGPNANPLDLFPQGLPNLGGTGGAGAGTLDFLRNSQQFNMLRSMVQANPQILQPMLQELAKQNPHLMRLIQEHQSDFHRLINEPVELGEGNPLGGDFAAQMPQAIAVTPEEREAIERLEAMGFDRATVLEVFFACNKNEELAANYLLDNMHDYDD